MGVSGSTEITLQSKFVLTFKTIITVIVTIGSMLWTYHTFVLEKQFEHLEAIREYADSATGLTNQLLGFARGGCRNDSQSKQAH